ncbi:hypothetical protein ACFL20_07135, partial [Spirochaetota bacterium]
AVAVASGGPAYDTVAEYLERIMGIMGSQVVGNVGVSLPEMDDDELKSDVINSASDLSAKLINAITNKEIYEEQQEKIDEHLEIMKFLVSMQKDAWSYEYEYLKNNFGMEDYE